MPNVTLVFAGFLQSPDGSERGLNGLLRSFSRAFREDRPIPRSATLVVVSLVAGGVIAALAWRLFERWQVARADTAAFARLADERGLDEVDIALLHSIAARGGTSILQTARHLEVFERAMAAELRGREPTTAVHEGDIFAATHRLRERLGFATLDPHDAILTTRELAPGIPVELSGARTVVAEVTEAFFSVHLSFRPEFSLGEKVALGIIHQDEAKYFVTCELLATEWSEEGWRIVFGHDESPARTQRQRYVRVHPGGVARVQYGGDLGALGKPGGTLEGALIDVGVGGAAVRSTTLVEPRTHAWVTFSILGMDFQDIEATVLGCEGPPEGPYRLRVEFIRLSVENVRRFGVAIAHAAGRRLHAPSTSPPGG